VTEGSIESIQDEMRFVKWKVGKNPTASDKM